MFQKNWNPWPIFIGMAVAMTAIAVFYRQIKEMSKTGRKSSPQTGKWETKEFRGISRAQKP
mgnify:CR=1 FL=1